ncbi:hypothetical protein DPMN_154942 [Dreissena polymorpha]|uniref:Uncharacterized protein n=1 Tax=Dreissena polymorpha TaxID=45954 RepID=A0A9D4FLF7_DREPO|nr:hypothetical protein DPMN_154942 [Dreissena polymorpha]
MSSFGSNDIRDNLGIETLHTRVLVVGSHPPHTLTHTQVGCPGNHLSTVVCDHPAPADVAFKCDDTELLLRCDDHSRYITAPISQFSICFKHHGHSGRKRCPVEYLSLNDTSETSPIFKPEL